MSNEINPTNDAYQFQLEQAQRLELIGSLTGGIAHDLNNQLTVILNHIDLCLHRVPPEDTVHASLCDIQRAALRCADMTSRLLRFSAKSEPRLRSTPLAELLDETEKLLRGALPSSIWLCLVKPPSLPTILADATQIQQVLVNLSVNARDAMPGGGRLEIRADDHTDSVVVSVSDTGSGMASEVQERIFEPFYTTKGDRGGTGLGLAMVAAIVQSHKGEIEVSSTPGEGTCFRITLPAERDKSGAEQERSTKVAGGGCVLIAEDDELVRRLASTILSIHGYKVLEAKDGEEAVRIFTENPGKIDLVFFDITMPKSTGVEALAQLRSAHPDVKALLTSGFDVLVNGPFLAKPYSPSELTKKIEELLEE